jgi:heme/copper-type cytochrome/quinol oxidase subunit 4
MKPIALLLALLIEIAVFISPLYAATEPERVNYWVVGAAVVLTLAMTIFWGLYMAPKSEQRWSGRKYLTGKFIIYGIAVMCLWAEGIIIPAFWLIVLILFDELLRRHYYGGQTPTP